MANTRDDWQHVKRIAAEALSQPAGNRPAYIAAACGADETLRREVASLVAAAADAADLYEQPPFGSEGAAALLALVDEEAPTHLIQSSGRRLTLPPGTMLGEYEVQSLLGAGGMGQVYRARDRRLRRDVAVKVLPSVVSSDPDRLRRFEQEAQAAAALNHPNILAVHQMGTYEGAPYLVSELLEGETLREQLARGRIAVRRAIDYGVQVARGLAAAHQKGIAHRDLKPENLFVTKDGHVKILDFGLAKLFQPHPSSAHSATFRDRTEPGLVMGTVGYMAPEQVRGEASDHRSDIFAYGAILYEMVTGHRAFQKSTTPETMTMILREDPRPIAELAPDAPQGLQRVVHRCLEKKPEQRFHSASDLGFALEGLSDASGSSIGLTPVTKRFPWRTSLRLVAEAAVLGIALILFFARPTSETQPSQVRAAILPPPGDGFWANLTQPAAISPDGRFVALVAMRNGHHELWLRRMDSSDAQPIVGSQGAANPFWSPDSRSIAFFVRGRLKRVDVSGGAVSDICPSGAFGMGGAWSQRGVIVFATFGRALSKVSASGGVPEPIPGSELSSDAISQLWPAFLPDGQHFLYLDWRYAAHDSHDNGVWIGSLDGEKARRLPLSNTNARYSGGYLLFSRDGDLVAQKFDLAQLELSGAMLPIARNIQYDTFFHDAMFTASAGGTLVYGTAGTGVNTQLTWLDRTGKVLAGLGEPEHFENQAISPDGKRVAVNVKFTDARERVWIYDVDRGTRIPLSGESGGSLYSPLWSPDGKQVAYRDTVGKSSTLLVHNSDGSGDDRAPGSIHFELITPSDWSPDGRYFALNFTKFQGRQNWEDRLRVVQDDGKPVLDIDNAGYGRFSPDGHWLAYDDESSSQVYVTSFPGPGPRIAVTTGGGGDVRWRGDGQELFYVANDLSVISVQVRESAREFRVLSSKPLFRLQLPTNVGFYDVTRDGQRFLVNIRTLKQQTEPLTVATNWLLQLQSEPRNVSPKN
jgi:serine/threonine protein kinase